MALFHYFLIKLPKYNLGITLRTTQKKTPLHYTNEESSTKTFYSVIYLRMLYLPTLLETPYS
jgi:hypothetical protein